MKFNIIKTGILLACLLTCFSCNKDFLDQTDPNSVAVSEYFSSENDVLLAVNGIYQSIRSSNSMGEGSSLYTDTRSDDRSTYDQSSNSGEPFQFPDFSLVASNSYVKAHWTALYTTVSRANTVLSHIDEVTFSDADLKSQYTAEAKFLRAMSYFHLVRKWGAIPLVTTELTTTDQVNASTVRVAESEVYAQIVEDLTDVVTSSLPDQQTGSDLGRVSKAAGNALLGQVYLTMATNLSDGNSQTYLTNAETYLTNAYNMRTFGELSEIAYTDVFDVDKQATCAEIILPIVYIQGDVNYSSSIAYSNQPTGETVNSQKTNSGYGGTVKHDLVNEYETSDPRKDFSIHYASATTVQDWYISKYRDISDAAGTNGYGGNYTILMRYADVVLMLAEVNMYLGDNATAITYLNMVRTRAGMPTYETMQSDASYTSKFPTLKLAILHERRVELAFEHHRWFDLLRFFTTDELVTFFQAKSQDDYGLASLSNFSTKDRYFPIPYDEYTLNPTGMYQNPGY
ncbi:MAG: RagB/SusD family nutrient uptake outer membrane protein [Siphonobacter sp.]